MLGSSSRKAPSTRVANPGVVACIITVSMSCALAVELRASEPPLTEEIVVTGSHLRAATANQPAPVDVFDSAVIARSGVNTIADFARYLPYNVGVPNDAQLADTPAAGATYFNLRGLGPGATLTLVNGLRVAPYGAADTSGLVFVDLSAIPLGAIDRIEVLKDSGSAIYGSDAVGGVVNIIVKDQFEGAQLSVAHLGTSRGDARELSADLTAGRNWKRTKLMGTLSYLDRTSLKAIDRAYLAEPDLRSIGGHNLRSGFSSPPSVFRPLVRAVQAAPTCPEEGSGHPVAFMQSVPAHPIFDSFCRYNQRREADAIPTSTRWGITGRLNQALAPATDLIVEGMMNQTDTHSATAPAVTDKTPIEGLRFPLVPADHPGNPYREPLELNYRTSDVGPVSRDTESLSWRVAAIVRGLWGDWSWSATALWSASELDTDQRNLVDSIAFQTALLGDGGVDGNSYYDPFALYPSNSDDVLSLVEIPKSKRHERRRERTAEFQLSRAFSALSAGPAEIALGYQRRDQRSVAGGDAFQTSGVALGTELLRPFDGQRDIDSIYAELLLPVHQHVDVQLAARYEHYTDFGGTTDPKIALRWQLLDDIAIRASMSTSFRAPTFTELFEPAQESTVFVTDSARCSITGAPFDCTPAPTDVMTGGNSDLMPEKGKSWFAGFIWSPAAWPGFDLKIDLWRFEHTQRIVQVDPQFVVDQLGGNPALVERGGTSPGDPPGAPGMLRRVNAIRLNLDQLRVQGADFSLRLEPPELAGTFVLQLDATYLDQYVFSQGAEEHRQHRDLAGGAELFPLPHLRGNLTAGWLEGRNSVTATLHYVGGYRSPLNYVIDGMETRDAFHVNSLVTLDFQFGHTFANIFDGVFHIGCQNCTDAKPPRYNYTITGEQLHDPRGAVYYLRWTQPL